VIARAMLHLLGDRVRVALVGPPLVIAAMLNGAIARLSIDEGITPERIRVVTTWDRRLWRLLVDKAEVFQVFDHAGAITGTWACPPEAAHAASLWMEGAHDDDDEA
jgi:hypothetical protein